MEAQELDKVLKRFQALENSVENLIKMGPAFNPDTFSKTIVEVIKKTTRDDDKIKYLQELIWISRGIILLILLLIFLIAWLAK